MELTQEKLKERMAELQQVLAGLAQKQEQIAVAIRQTQGRLQETQALLSYTQKPEPEPVARAVETQDWRETAHKAVEEAAVEVAKPTPG